MFGERYIHDLEARNATEAIDATGRLLLADGLIEERYIQAMHDTLAANGNYIVIAPGIAIAHSRPDRGALGNGLAVAKLKAPVAFGHPQNDPVDVVFALAAVSGEEHVRNLGKLAVLLIEGEFVAELRGSKNRRELGEIIARYDADLEADSDVGPKGGSE